MDANYFEILSDTQVHVVENGNIVMKTVDNASAYIDSLFGTGKAAEFLANKDPRKQPDYYLVRESVGKALVNEVANELLLKYKNGEFTLVQVMEIEQILDNTMSALGRGQIISALYHISNATGIDSTFKSSIASRIQALKVAHYA